MRNLILGCLALFVLMLSCKKTEPNWREYTLDLSTPDIEQTSELTATIRYTTAVKGDICPEILEFGLIISADAEAPFHGTRYPNENSFSQVNQVLYLSKLEAGTYWYVRSYAVTSRDTVLSKINSFKTGTYFSEGNGLMDIEGNFYKTVKIGNQEWMSESLRARTFCNGDTLVLANNAGTFGQFGDSIPITMSYQFDVAYDTIYGKYYPGMVAFDDRNICPCGWRIPTKGDLVELANFVGNNQYLGGKMKSTGILENGTGLWLYPNAMANNLTGLNINPGGYFTRGQNNFSSVHSVSQIMYTEPTVNNNGVLVDYPYALVLRSIRREIDLWGVGENVGYVNIRCIRE